MTTSLDDLLRSFIMLCVGFIVGRASLDPDLYSPPGTRHASTLTLPQVRPVDTLTAVKETVERTRIGRIAR
jgi:hypothetical protein